MKCSPAMDRPVSFHSRPFRLACGTLLIFAAAQLACPGSFARTDREMITDADQRDRFMDPFCGPAGSRAPNPDQSRALGDTLWFGGHDGSGYALEGSIWDFEGDGGQGDLQGWISIDRTENLDTYFGRVTAADFANDPVVPMINEAESVGQIWCGIHEDDANLLDFVTGLGYGNSYCQSAFSPIFPVGQISIAFDCFQDSEFEWDYTYLFVRCLDSGGALLPDGEIELDRFTGIHGSPQEPASWIGGLGVLSMPPQTAQVQLEFRFRSDSAWSDQDGLYDCVWGAFAADNVMIEVAGSPLHLADFETGEDGYTFGRCPGVGSFMGLVDETTYSLWLDTVGLGCSCTLSGWALEFNDEEGSPYPFPGHRSGQLEMGISPIVDRSAVDPEEYNTTWVRYDRYLNVPYAHGTFWRPGYMVYPHTTEVNPQPHWSQRLGQNDYYYNAAISCGSDFTNLSTLDGKAGTRIPTDYEQMRFVYEVYCSCSQFGIPSTICVEEGNNQGSPLVDNVRVGLLTTPDAPRISADFMLWFHDGYGQLYPTYLDPADVGNSNTAYDWSGANYSPDERNDWQSDSVVVIGPTVSEEEDRWLAEMCFRITHKGPMQDIIPEYAAWKARLGGDPEADYVCVLMDSLETAQGVWKNRFLTYFHEDDPGFDPAYPDCRSQQAILPDSIWTPGTRIEYYYRGFWYNAGAPAEEYGTWPIQGTESFEILPGMRVVSEDPYTIQWPSVLYVDAYNRGAEYYIRPILEQAGLEFDQYDYLFASACCHAPIVRSFGGTTYNPGGYGNNGLTLEQALGYRLIILDTGNYGQGAMENKDWPFFHDWIASTECGALNVRRGLIFCGNGIADILDSYVPHGSSLLEEVFGATLTDRSYREYSGDDEWCVRMSPSDGAAYSIPAELTLYGNGCPTTTNYGVLGLSGIEGAVGNLDFHDGSSPWEFAQVVRDRVVADQSNWRSSIAGFSLMKLSAEGCQGTLCSGDSACVVGAGRDFMVATLDWMTEGAAPFRLWNHTCDPAAAENDAAETHLAGPVTHLFAARPNPFHQAATIRFHLARTEHAQLSIYDVTGRWVCDLLDADLAGEQEHSVTWDGRTAAGDPVGNGVFWMQLSTESGYRSSKRMIVMR